MYLYGPAAADWCFATRFAHLIYILEIENYCKEVLTNGFTRWAPWWIVSGGRKGRGEFSLYSLFIQQFIPDYVIISHFRIPHTLPLFFNENEKYIRKTWHFELLLHPPWGTPRSRLGSLSTICVYCILVNASCSLCSMVMHPIIPTFSVGRAAMRKQKNEEITWKSPGASFWNYGQFWAKISCVHMRYHGNSIVCK